MKKSKIIALVMATVLVCTAFSGCMGAPPPVPALEVSADKADPPMGNYENNLEGLTAYLTDCQLISGEGTAMSFDFIGAIAGKKYIYKYAGSSISCEFYEYDAGNLNDTAKSILGQITEKGKFKSLDKEVNAVLSDSGKFMMVYINAGTDEVQKKFSEKMNGNFKAFQGK
ncbi:MAG: hypothetical protein RSC76_04775 [Oscillospiraceae bacterium]